MKGASDAVAYTPTDDFEEFNKDFDIDISDDKELWLFHWPLNSAPDINGKTLSLKLHNNAILGTCEGKQYEVLSTENRKSGATVFLPSSSDCQIVGVKARQVSLLHYPDPKELLESNQSAYKKMAERSAAASSMRSKSSGLRSGRTGTVVTGGSGDTPLKRHAGKRVRSIDLSLEDSRRESNSGAPSGSLEQSQERKLKKKRKLEA